MASKNVLKVQKFSGASHSGLHLAEPGTRVDRVMRLDDPAVHKKLAALKVSLADPVRAREFLQDVGTLTSSGKLSKRYGGG
jgi:hypothetical protein